MMSSLLSIRVFIHASHDFFPAAVDEIKLGSLFGQLFPYILSDEDILSKNGLKASVMFILKKSVYLEVHPLSLNSQCDLNNF